MSKEITRIVLIEREKLKTLLLPSRSVNRTIKPIYSPLATKARKLIADNNIEIPTRASKNKKVTILSDDALDNLFKKGEKDGYNRYPNLDIISAILILILFDEKEEDIVRINYELEDLQKAFVHIQKNEALLNSGYRDEFNKFIEITTKESKVFNGIYINENWEIDGEKVNSNISKVYLEELLKNNNFQDDDALPGEQKDEKENFGETKKTASIEIPNNGILNLSITQVQTNEQKQTTFFQTFINFIPEKYRKPAMYSSLIMLLAVPIGYKQFNKPLEQTIIIENLNDSLVKTPLSKHQLIIKYPNKEYTANFDNNGYAKVEIDKSDKNQFATLHLTDLQYKLMDSERKFTFSEDPLRLQAVYLKPTLDSTIKNNIDVLNEVANDSTKSSIIQVNQSGNNYHSEGDMNFESE